MPQRRREQALDLVGDSSSRDVFGKGIVHQNVEQAAQMVKGQ